MIDRMRADMLEFARMFGGEDGVAEMARAIKQVDEEPEVVSGKAAQWIDDVIKLYRSLLDTKVTEETWHTIRKLSYCVCLFVSEGMVAVATMTMDMVATAYKLGLRDAGLQMFQEAEVKEEEGD